MWVDFGAGYGLGVDDWLGHSMIDAWARRGSIATDVFPHGLPSRPGKSLVDATESSRSRRESPISIS